MHMGVILCTWESYCAHASHTVLMGVTSTVLMGVILCSWGSLVLCLWESYCAHVHILLMFILCSCSYFAHVHTLIMSILCSWESQFASKLAVSQCIYTAYVSQNTTSQETPQLRGPAQSKIWSYFCLVPSQFRSTG